jgi:hypothetical protein
MVFDCKPEASLNFQKDVLGLEKGLPSNYDLVNLPWLKLYMKIDSIYFIAYV